MLIKTFRVRRFEVPVVAGGKQETYNLFLLALFAERITDMVKTVYCLNFVVVEGGDIYLVIFVSDNQQSS